MTLVQRSKWSGTPIKAGLSPAAAHCAELRSFRRGCIALLCLWEPNCKHYSLSMHMHLPLLQRLKMIAKVSSLGLLWRGFSENYKKAGWRVTFTLIAVLAFCGGASLETMKKQACV